MGRRRSGLADAVADRPFGADGEALGALCRASGAVHRMHGHDRPGCGAACQPREGRSHLQQSQAIGLYGKGALAELRQAYILSREPNWDGYGALPISETTYYLALQFLDSLPLGVPTPTFGAEPDGHLTFEWYHSSRRTLSVSVGPLGELHYAALIADNKAYGTEVFFGEAPKIIVDLIYRVTAA